MLFSTSLNLVSTLIVLNYFYYIIAIIITIYDIIITIYDIRIRIPSKIN